METFSFFFGLSISYDLYTYTDNSSKTLQAEKIPHCTSKKTAELLGTVFESLRTDKSFKIFYMVITDNVYSLWFAEKPILTRKKKVPNHSIFQYVEGQQRNSISPCNSWGSLPSNLLWGCRSHDFNNPWKTQSAKFWSLRKHGISSFEIYHFPRCLERNSLLARQIWQKITHIAFLWKLTCWKWYSASWNNLRNQISSKIPTKPSAKHSNYSEVNFSQSNCNCNSWKVVYPCKKHQAERFNL